MEREEQEEQLEATEGGNQAVEPGQRFWGFIGLDEAVEQDAARQETQPEEETVGIIKSGG